MTFGIHLMMDSKMLFAIFLSERFIYYYLLEVTLYFFILLKTIK